MTDEPELLGDWLDRELASTPQELALRIRGSLPNDWRTAPLADGPTLLAAAASAELRDLLERGCENRRAAPGLLTVDALVTYACELLAVTGTDIGAGTSAILNMICETFPDDGSAA